MLPRMSYTDWCSQSGVMSGRFTHHYDWPGRPDLRVADGAIVKLDVREARNRTNPGCRTNAVFPAS